MDEDSKYLDGNIKAMIGPVNDLEQARTGGDDRSESSSSETPVSASSSDPTFNKNKIGAKETNQVFRLRLLVFMVLLMAAAAVSVIVYFVTTGSEQEEYKSQFEGAAKLVQETFIDIVESRLSVLSGLGVAIAAHAIDHETQRWPFVTLSSFQQRASTARKQSGTMYIQVNPYVTVDQREEWEQFVVGKDSDWIREDLDYQDGVVLFGFANESSVTLQQGADYNVDINNENPWPIWYRDENDEIAIDKTKGPYMPTWQTSPVFHDGTESNENILESFRTASEAAMLAFQEDSVVISEFLFAPPGDIESENPYTAFYSQLLSVDRQNLTVYSGDPWSQVFFPIFDEFGSNRDSVGILVAWVHWKSYFRRILPASIKGLHVVLSDSCGSSFTYVLDGPLAEPVGLGDLHERQFSSMQRTASYKSVKNIADGTRAGLPLYQEACNVHISIYPSQKFYALYITELPMLLTAMVGVIFLFTAFMFVFYDRLVERRQSLVLTRAIETTAIVTSLFPAEVADRLIQANNTAKTSGGKGTGPMMGGNNRLKGFINAGQDEDDNGLQPIADLFPHCTVLFADIAGFTAWSSTREPAQVFILLQTVYQAFDMIAKRRKVFKVETIGDSYLAVTGLPEPMANHAVVMVRFAHEAAVKLDEVTKDLEQSLGPDTSDLTMRFGLHSGPVTAGVLRGERARFQLFGDTVNTASRMESTGVKGKIQVSSATAKYMADAGKEHWLKLREDQIDAKGKGAMKTYWANPMSKKGSSTATSSDSGDAAIERAKVQLSKSGVAPVNQRLVSWMVDLLMDDIKKIVQVRQILKIKDSTEKLIYRGKGGTFLDEAQDIIKMPEYNAAVAENMNSIDSVEISPVVVQQLRVYVTMIASMYRSNPFHNFEHACHVTMSVKKLLKRIVTPDIVADEIDDDRHIASKLYDLTHGLNSDALAGFAITLSALIHDVDHRGISNMQLAKELPELAEKFHSKSLAEQNSLDLAWETLMDNRFEKLRRCLFTSEKELLRFRQLIVNVVLATDIFDKELNDLRKQRWNQAFAAGKATSIPTPSSPPLRDSISIGGDFGDLRATIVIEHIIQASDVSHTMQHWHVYQKWNKCLYKEMHAAFKAGRMAKDPSEFWYQGEMAFFDSYVIPLAKKLKECGVFGVSSDEYYNYAVQNRMEWEQRGEEMVKEIQQELL